MDVECVSPFNVVAAPGCGRYQVLVRHEPEYRGDDDPGCYGVHKYHPQNEFDASHDPDSRHEGKNDRRNH